MATPTNGNRVLTVTSDSLPMIVDRVQAAEAVEKDTADLQIFTDGSRLEVKDGVGAAAVCKLGRSDGDGSSSWDYRASYIGVAGTYSALQAELFGVIQSLRFVEERIMMRKKGDARLKTVTIFTDCREVERLLRAPIAPREQYLVSFFHNELQRLVECRPRMTVALKWLPGHSGVEGNEVADKRAKEAAKEKRRKGVVAAISVEKQDIIKADAVEA